MRALVSDLASEHDVHVARCRFDLEVGGVGYTWNPTPAPFDEVICIDEIPDDVPEAAATVAVLLGRIPGLDIEALSAADRVASPHAAKYDGLAGALFQRNVPLIHLPPAMPERADGHPHRSPGRTALAPWRPDPALAMLLLSWPAIRRVTDLDLVVTGSVDRLWRRCADHPEQMLAERLRGLLCQPGVAYRPTLPETEFEALADCCSHWLLAEGAADALGAARAARHGCSVVRLDDVLDHPDELVKRVEGAVREGMEASSSSPLRPELESRPGWSSAVLA